MADWTVFIWNCPQVKQWLKELIMKTPPKEGLIAITSMLRFFQTKERKRLDGMPPEDIMEQGADFLEDEWSRKFFMTVCGFSRMANHLLEQNAQEKTIAWLTWRYPFLEENEKIRENLPPLIELACHKPNWNITFKRLVAILSQSERTTMAEGLVHCLAPDGNLKPLQVDTLEDLLTKLLLSENLAAELIENRRKG